MTLFKMYHQNYYRCAQVVFMCFYVQTVENLIKYKHKKKKKKKKSSKLNKQWQLVSYFRTDTMIFDTMRGCVFRTDSSENFLCTFHSSFVKIAVGVPNER